MKYCKYCGKEVEDDAVVCIHCGRSLREENPVAYDDTGSIGWGFLGFFFPVVGLILYLVWKDTKPKTSKVAGKGALIGFIAGVVLGICYGVVIASALSNYNIQLTFFQKLF